jgi:DNA-binding cell septation regulator SpoVG
MPAMRNTKVDEINIVPVKPNSGLIAFASFVLDTKLYVGNVAIFTRLDGQGIRLVYPTKNSINCVHPISREVGDAITKAVQEQYEKVFPSQLPEDVYESSLCNDAA